MFPSRNYTTPRHSWLIFCTLQTTLYSTFQEDPRSSTTGSIITSQGRRSKSKTHGTSSNFNKPPTSCELYTELYNMQHKPSHVENKLQTCRAIRREKESDTEWPERRNVRRGKCNEKVYKLQLPPTQESISFLVRKRESSTKSTSWGGGKRGQVLNSLKYKIWW
jgi:hypothetical protein